MTIHYILTGGTIDSHYDGMQDTAIPNKSSVVPNFIKNLKLYSKAVFTEVCMKDSRSLTPKDRNNILKEIGKSSHEKIIITHGTYTMPDTARFLKTHLKRKDQTIILTGSMIPLDGFTFSDGPFSLGFAIGKIDTLSPGIYVCMNGKVFIPEEVVKEISQGRFASVFTKNKD